MTALKKSAASSSRLPRPRTREVGILLLLALSIFLLIALFSYHPGDPGWSRSGDGTAVRNWGGAVGAWLSDVLFSLIGRIAYLLPLVLPWLALHRLGLRRAMLRREGLLPVAGVVLLLLSLAALAALREGGEVSCNLGPGGVYPCGAGGLLGAQLAGFGRDVVGLQGSSLLLLTAVLAGLSLSAGVSWLAVLDGTGRLALELGGWLAAALRRWTGALRAWRQRRREQQLVKKAETASRLRQQEREKSARERQIAGSAPPAAALVAEKPSGGRSLEIRREAPDRPLSTAPRQPGKMKSLFDAKVTGDIPPVDILNRPDSTGERGYTTEELEALSRRLEHKLEDFGISAEVVAVYPGPVITRFEIQPAAGTKVSTISGLAKDLARSLAVISVRVVEVIPGKDTVGIEIPNESRSLVNLYQVLNSSAWRESSSPLSLALGHDIAGDPVVVELGGMPHLLVAGTTGSGKSVGINIMLLSLLFKSTPAQVRLILVDPKMLELSVYEGVPHLLTPVITDMRNAANGLRWCVAEMERRYRLMAALGVRNLEGYNHRVEQARETGSPLKDPLWKPVEEADSLFNPQSPNNSTQAAEKSDAPELEVLPSIVVIIDEFADMMMIVGKKVEELIARISQKARAAGIHLILATQRPSVDVITGLIKANIPTRIAYQVSSKIDSRTILDQNGAEQLLGHGDMLYLTAGSGTPMRVHGAFVSDEEVHRVVSAWKQLGEANYLEEVIRSSGDVSRAPIPGLEPAGSGDDEADPLYDEALRLVTTSRRASISSVQRQLRIGYNRAARLVEAMEKAGAVSAADSSGNRTVLAPPPPEDV